jgi:hypothetical protein
MSERCQAMSGRGDILSKERWAWLLAVGRRLKAEYDAVGKSLPPPLAALLEQVETRVGVADQDEAPQPRADEKTPRT